MCNIKTHIEVDGVIFTPECLQMIKYKQERGNIRLDLALNNLTEVISFIRKIYIEADPEDQIEASVCISKLGMLQDDIKKLAKP